MPIANASTRSTRHGTTNSALQRAFQSLFHRRARHQASQLAPWIPPQSAILDFGCGDGLVSATLARRMPLTFTTLDVMDYRLDRTLPFVLHDGGPLPFPDASFDVVIAAFALHHTTDPEFHLAEIVRVCRDRVLLLEDTYRNRLELALTKLLDRAGNLVECREVAVPFTFRSEAEWAAQFDRLRLEVLRAERFYNHVLSYLVPRHVFYVLRRSRD